MLEVGGVIQIAECRHPMRFGFVGRMRGGSHNDPASDRERTHSSGKSNNIPPRRK
jgi:hypothetical protein